MVDPSGNASPVPATTTESAVFLTAKGLSNFTVGFVLVSVLTVTGASGSAAAPAGAPRIANAPNASERVTRTTAGRRTRAAFGSPTGLSRLSVTRDDPSAGASARAQVQLSPVRSP